MAISPQWVIRYMHFMFGSRVEFSGSAVRMALVLVTLNPRWWPAAILENFEWPYLRNGWYVDPIHLYSALARIARHSFLVALWYSNGNAAYNVNILLELVWKHFSYYYFWLYSQLFICVDFSAFLKVFNFLFCIVLSSCCRLLYCLDTSTCFRPITVLGHNFTLPHTDSNLYKNSFINRCLFQSL